MKDKINKTNAIRILDAAKAKYELLSLNLHEAVAVNARKVAEILGKKPEEVFKTLVTVGKPPSLAELKTAKSITCLSCRDQPSV